MILIKLYSVKVQLLKFGSWLLFSLAHLQDIYSRDHPISLELFNSPLSRPFLQENRLSGWKAIANYLQVTPRTVQLWERNLGFPVYRTSTRTVWADKTDIGVWQRRDKESLRKETQYKTKSRRSS